MEEHKGATTGVAVGAATGALAGALIGGKGDRTEGAIIGGLIGAAVGGAVGHFAYDKRKDREETEKTYNYQPSAGTMVRLEGGQAVPATIAPGGTVNLEATFAVLSPNAGDQISITEVREVRFGGELVARPESTVKRAGGTYTSKVPLQLGPQAAKGTYKVLVTVSAGEAKDAREYYFTVQ
jgi:hypothetical protein